MTLFKLSLENKNIFQPFYSKACFASLVSQDYVNGTDQEEIRTGGGKGDLIWFPFKFFHIVICLCCALVLQVLTNVYNGSLM